MSWKADENRSGTESSCRLNAFRGWIFSRATMEIAYGVLGLLGALLTVYLARQEIPEFRYIIDPQPRERDFKLWGSAVDKEEKALEELLQQVKASAGDRTESKTLLSLLNLRQEELTATRIGHAAARKALYASLTVAKFAGFILYIGFGGVTAYLLTGRITIEGLEGDVSNHLQSLVIGATWTTYLSAIGLASLQAENKEKQDKNFQALKTELIDELNEGQSKVIPKLRDSVAKAVQAGPPPQVVTVPDVEDLVGEEFTALRESLTSRLEGAQEDFKRQCKPMF